MRAAFLTLLVLCCAGPAFGLVINADTTWRGEQTFAEEVRVPKGVTLTIAPGTTVHFHGAGLEVTGQLVAREVVFSGRDWTGLVLKGVDASTRLVGCRVAGAATGIRVQGGAPVLESLELSGNDIGVELRGRAAGRLVRSRFFDNRKVGLFAKEGSTTVIHDCLFEANRRYAAYLYRARPERFEANRFVGNDTALMIAYRGSDAEVSKNLFVDNDVAIQVDRAAKPVVRDNLLRGNRTGLSASRRSDPTVCGNRFEQNATAVRIAYSSYPRIVANDFVANDLAVKLEFQSSRWEEERGAAARAAETAERSAFAGRGMRQVTERDRRAETLNGRIDTAGNWWGDRGTRELARIGGEGNPTFIHDGRDQKTFVDAGRTYPLDRVKFSPWREAAVAEDRP